MAEAGGPERRNPKFSPARQALAEQRLRLARSRAAAPTIPRLADADRARAPLSFAQQRVWFFQQYDPASPAYHRLTALRLQGSLDLDCLERSLNQIVRRHEVLRTVFPLIDGEPVQQVRPQARLHLSIRDLTDLPEQERVDAARSLAARSAKQSFNLEAGPLVRLQLLRLTADDHVLLFLTHHILFDRWSESVLVHELGTLYEALLAKRDALLPDLPVQYADYAAWQREQLADTLLPELAYWRERLGGELPALDLPADHPRPPLQTTRGASRSLVLGRTLTQALRELSRREGVTLFMTLLAAFDVLLYRYTGQEDILVGTPIAGRRWVETEPLIGVFVNTLVLRVSLAGDPTFRELLSPVRDVCLGGYAHSGVPFERLVEELRTRRDPSRSPLFQVIFNLENVPEGRPPFQSLRVSPFEIISDLTLFDQTWELVERDGQLVCCCVFNSDLFEPGTVERMLGHFRTLLEGVVENPNQRLSGLRLLTEAERRLLVAEWNDTRVDFPPALCLYQMFEDQVERTPDAVAVVFGQECLTYRRLNDKANQLARHLKRLGVGPDVRVGICVERSLEMVIGLLGILKAGGAYVPLDPAYPRARLAFILGDVQAPVILTQGALLKRLPPHDAQPVLVDADHEVISRYSVENPINGVSADNLAYVIHTSGSTGEPKGVEIQQRSVVGFLHSIREEPGLSAKDVLLAVTTLSFDMAALEIFLPLTVGACLVLAGREVAMDGAQLAASMVESGVTVMQATPATWRMLLDSGWQGDADLKILCGGEALPRFLADRLLARCASLWNLYGPTETTVWSTVERVMPGEGPVPIGRPIANTEIYLLDTFLRPVPLGVPGELYIGGVGVARGYRSRPELTAERFIPDPFRDGGPSRLYRTGDWARYLPDGHLEFLGRKDQQVKIRGFRIELEEIERVLERHPAVRQAAVVAAEVVPGDRRLAAYLVMPGEAPPSVGELRDYVKNRLPDYMVPAAFVTLEALPLTPSGKLDRRALPLPELARPGLLDGLGAGPEPGCEAPRTPLEARLVMIWAEVLGLDAAQVGVHDRFFDLGGHSLLATLAINRIWRALRVELPLSALFGRGTAADVARRITRILQLAARIQRPSPEGDERDVIVL